MAAHSAGILLYRVDPRLGLQVLIGHMGGPFWARREAGGWTIPKGEQAAGEDPLTAARREFREELGRPVPDGELLDLGTVRQGSGKTVSIWGVRADVDPATLVCNTVEMEWPRGSGRRIRFPEIDRFEWVDLRAACDRVVSAQRAFLDRLADRLGS
jgi:predicted NUDIX family NTP pyrophosphohydrolase